MKKLLAFLPLAALLAAPAAAVSVTGITAANGNSATVVTEADGLLEMDFAIRSQTPVSVDVTQSNANELDFDFNGFVDFFTAAELGRNVRTLSFALDGAVFEAVGSVSGAFSNASWVLNESANLLTISFDGPGEPLSATLGNVFGGDNFIIAFAPPESFDARRLNAPIVRNLPGSLDEGLQTATLTFQAGVVPEPATWAMMIAGFGLVGAVARRRVARVTA